ncbi:MULTISPECIES: hypothetical protein [unclassified Endozoicomonas]|uniref:hypothetical protein n=1 Tax=unclassified Endozoicomonas TaxID=2644528 RepID=UPI0021479B59|nr:MULTISPECIES: hypothetical protein [unclassified Endozoicomonas]
MDRIFKHSLFVALLLLLMSLPVICQAKPLTGRFIVEPEKRAVFPNQSFFKKLGLHTLPYNPSDVADTYDHAGSYSPPDDKQHNPDSYRERTTLIEWISWQWLFASRLLVGYERILIPQDGSLSPAPYSWLPREVVAVVAVAWLLKSYWNHNPPLFKPIEEQKTTSMLTQWDYPFVTFTMMLDSGHNQQPNSSSESSGQNTPRATTHPASSFTSLLRSGSAGGNGGPQTHTHNLGLNCFVFPCNGVCSFRSSTDSREPTEWSLNSSESSCHHLAHGLCLGCTANLNPSDTEGPQQSPPFDMLDYLFDIEIQCVSDQPLQRQSHGIVGNTVTNSNSIDGIFSDKTSSDSVSTGATCKTGTTGQLSCDVIIVGEDNRTRRCGKMCKSTKALSAHRSRYHTGQKICNEIVTREDSQPHYCGTLCKNAKVLSDHRRRSHAVQRICDETVIGEDGQQIPCRMVCKSAESLSDHKRKDHSAQKACDLIVIGEDGKPRPCETVCKNALSLSTHRSRYHTGQKICDVTVVSEDGQLRACGKICKNNQALSDHKRRDHSTQKTCGLTVIGEDGKPLPCGRVCKNDLSLSSHKSKYHTGQKTCNLPVVSEDGQLRACRKICKNAQALSDHKRRDHSGQQTCDVTVVGVDGQPRPCGTVCKTAVALSNHKRKSHTKQPTCALEVVGGDSQPPPCEKVYKNDQALENHKRRHRKRKYAYVNQ